MKKTLGTIAILLTAGTVLTGCTEGTLAKKAGDNSEVRINNCDTTGYRPANGMALKTKRTFFVCGGNECELESTVRYRQTKTRKVETDIPNPREITVPANAKSWKFEDCGTVYYRGAK